MLDLKKMVRTPKEAADELTPIDDLYAVNEALRAENERLRAALRDALEKATACVPVDRLHELEPLWAVLDTRLGSSVYVTVTLPALLFQL